MEHKTWNEVVPYITFAYNMAIQETTQMTLFMLVCGGRPATMLDAMLPHVEDDDLNADVQEYFQRVEEASQRARVCTTNQQLVDAARYKLQSRDAEYDPVDFV